MNLEQLFWPRARVKSNERVVVSEQGRLTDIPSNPQHHPDCSLQLSLQSLVIEVEQRLKKNHFQTCVNKNPPGRVSDWAAPCDNKSQVLDAVLAQNQRESGQKKTHSQHVPANTVLPHRGDQRHWFDCEDCLHLWKNLITDKTNDLRVCTSTHALHTTVIRS